MTQSWDDILYLDSSLPARKAVAVERPPADRLSRIVARHGKASPQPAEGAGPRIVANKASDSADVYIYGEISRWGVSAKDFAAQLAEITASELNVFVNSPGGSIFEGLAILNALRRHSAKVRVTVDGIAASAASFIAMAGDEIVMSRNSQMMIHDGLMYVDIIALANPEDIAGIIAELEKLQGDLERQSDNIAAIYAEAAAARGNKATAEDWRALMRAETWYFADEAVKAGLADRVDGAAADDDEPDDQAQTYFKYRSREDAPAPVIRPAAPVDQTPATPEPAEPFAFDPAVFRQAVKEGVHS